MKKRIGPRRKGMVGTTDETPKSHLPGRVMAEFRAVAARRQLRFRLPTYRQFAPISQVTR
jgi:hypothetical protein